MMRALRGALTWVGWVRGSGCMRPIMVTASSFVEPGMPGERIVDELLRDRSVAGKERGVAPGRGRREPLSHCGIDEVVMRTVPSAARLTDEPPGPRVDVSGTPHVAPPPAAHAAIEREPIAEMP